MSPITSFLSPDDPIPDPPEFKYLSLIVGGIFALLAIGFILFLLVEFTMDLSGNPIQFEEKPFVLDIDQEGQETVPAQKTHKDIAENALKQFVLLSPLSGTRVLKEDAHVLCTWDDRRGDQTKSPSLSPELYVDDLLVPWEMRFGSNTWLARLDLLPGLHRIRTTVSESLIYVEDPQKRDMPDMPKDWKLMKMHPTVSDPLRCGDCHERVDNPSDLVGRGRDLTIMPWQDHESCLACHPIPQWKATHRHPLQPLHDCRQCHAIHGSGTGEKSLLHSPMKSLCLQCHEIP